MKLSRTLISGLFLFYVLLVPKSTYAQVPNSIDAIYRETLVQLIQLLREQVSLLQRELSFKQSSEQSIKQRDEVRVDAGEYENLVFRSARKRTTIYNISDRSEVDSIKDSKHRAYFQKVFSIFPDQFDAKLNKLVVFDEKEKEFDAFVETLPPDYSQWVYSISNGVINNPDSDSSTELMIHELGHLVSYEEIVGLPSPLYTDCGVYFIDHGCPSQNSFIYQFAERFWSTDDLERVEEFSKTRNPTRRAYAYYDKHTNDFVSDYAAIGPEEDFAESFLFFVLGIEPDGNWAKQKVDFFGDYRELISISNTVNSNR